MNQCPISQVLCLQARQSNYYPTPVPCCFSRTSRRSESITALPIQMHFKLQRPLSFVLGVILSILSRLAICMRERRRKSTGMMALKLKWRQGWNCSSWGKTHSVWECGEGRFLVNCNPSAQPGTDTSSVYVCACVGGFSHWESSKSQVLEMATCRKKKIWSLACWVRLLICSQTRGIWETSRAYLREAMGGFQNVDQEDWGDPSSAPEIFGLSLKQKILGKPPFWTVS